jgi:XTP/dITP diphosphohydrolase
MGALMRKLDTRRIVVASHNKGKLAEIAALIGPFGFEAKSAGEYGLPEPAETGTAFEENAFIKAFAAASATGLPALADDSGLEVDALDRQPGVYTADWAEKPDGSGRDFMMAMEKTEALLREKGALADADRTGRFVSVLCLAWPDGHAEYFRGEVEGTLVWPPRGDKGHGYDPVFRPQGHALTFGEMEPAEKNGIEAPLSHRARSFAKFAEAMLEVAPQPARSAAR